MPAQVISFNCILKNKTGKLISSTFNREVLTDSKNAQASMLLGLAKGLQNLKKGERRIISLFAEEAYGLYDPQKIISLPRDKMPRKLHVGQMVTVVNKSGVQSQYKVLQIEEDFVSLDGNHPLAGQDLVFEIETLEARDVTSEDLDESVNVLTDQLWH